MGPGIRAVDPAHERCVPWRQTLSCSDIQQNQVPALRWGWVPTGKNMDWGVTGWAAVVQSTKSAYFFLGQ